MISTSPYITFLYIAYTASYYLTQNQMNVGDILKPFPPSNIYLLKYLFTRFLEALYTYFIQKPFQLFIAGDKVQQEELLRICKCVKWTYLDRQIESHTYIGAYIMRNYLF